ncbi:hypothetical protein AGDE_07581 [Angomonas deanei]|nr:hypothetical protein AGDE_07581 [Angomonas deanei]|eukprot:EPY35113.1 hypothetical protein AGDE_07581 [Angomonas deanei]
MNDFQFNDNVETESLDSFGLPRYEKRYATGGPGTDENRASDMSVPWYLRDTGKSRSCTFFDSLRSPQFWKQFEFATRITAIAVLVPSAIIAARLEHNPFVSPFMVISSTVLAAKGSVGEAVAYLFSWTRAGCFWLPFAVVGAALDLGNHMAGWCVYYTGALIIMAMFTEAIVMRICLLLFNSCMVGLLVDTSRGVEFPCRVMVDWCIGTGLCTVAAFFPYPIFCKTEAHKKLGQIAKNTGTAFRGLVHSFWSPSNVDRSMAMSKVKTMTESLDHLLPQFEHSQAFAFFEFFFESSEARQLRDVKFNLFSHLRVNLSSMTRVLDMVEENPEAIDDSDRSTAFGEVLAPHLDEVAESFDIIMEQLSRSHRKKSVMDLKPHFDAFKDHVEDLENAYLKARRTLFYEYTSDTIESFVPLMTFYLFTVICFRDTIEIFEDEVRKFKPSTSSIIKGIFNKVAWIPLKENLEFLKNLFSKHDRQDVQRVIEAVKVSGAMILTIGFSYLIKIDKASFSGPNIIAFVSGSNPVEAVQASIVRLTGCLLGTVLGFFAGSFSVTPVQRVASLCTLMFCGTFLRNDKEYGVMSVYGMFVLIPLDSILETTVTDTVARMNQNTFGIFIYLFVSALIFPLSPSKILRLKRANVLRSMSTAVGQMMKLFVTPTVSQVGIDNIRMPSDGLFEETSDSNDQSNGKPQLSNRSIHMMFSNDGPMEALEKSINNTIKRLKGTKPFMGFAKDERTIVEINYPVKSCESTYLHMYRMTFLLKTMWMSWNVIRSQRRLTKETQHIMNSLGPIASDLSSAFAKFVDLMTYMIENPRVNLEGDLTKVILDLIECANELERRKSQLILIVINESVAQYRGADSAPLDLGKGNSSPEDSTQPSTASSSFIKPMPTRPSSTIYTKSRSGLQRSRTFDVLGAQSPTTYHSMLDRENFQVSPSVKNVTIEDYMRRHHSTEHIAAGEPVSLPANFNFPVSSEDVEGLHSFCLCMSMFANETRMLTMSLDTMLDLLRTRS